MVVRRPCCIFWSILVICLVINFLLVAVVFRDGNPFDEPSSEYDINDIRSINYDSLKLARDEVRDAREEAANEAGIEPAVQSEDLDITYWVFEGETDEGVFGSASAIQEMKDAFDLFIEDQDYDMYCKLKYDSTNSMMTNGTNSTTPTETPCDLPITPLVAYYASSWDTEMVTAAIEELKVPENVDLFNQVALCYTRGLYCELVPEGITQEQIQWAVELGSNLTAITSTWDMKGELVEDFNQVTELAAYLLKVDIFRGTVIFGYDTKFSVENPKSAYSRGILLWGGPLNVRGDLDDTDNSTNTVEDDDAKTEQDEEDLKE